MAAEEDLIERCEFIHVHEDIVAKVTENTFSLSRRCASVTLPSCWV